MYNLHSSMVRLEMKFRRYKKEMERAIYIPVWLDQKFSNFHKVNFSLANLHSSMVRLEIELYTIAQPLNLRFTFQYGQIRNIYGMS